jgi:hypothetical protein
MVQEVRRVMSSNAQTHQVARQDGLYTVPPHTRERWGERGDDQPIRKALISADPVGFESPYEADMVLYYSPADLVFIIRDHCVVTVMAAYRDTIDAQNLSECVQCGNYSDMVQNDLKCPYCGNKTQKIITNT